MLKDMTVGEFFQKFFLKKPVIPESYYEHGGSAIIERNEIVYLLNEEDELTAEEQIEMKLQIKESTFIPDEYDEEDDYDITIEYDSWRN